MHEWFLVTRKSILWNILLDLSQWWNNISLSQLQGKNLPSEAKPSWLQVITLKRTIKIYILENLKGIFDCLHNAVCGPAVNLTWMRLFKVTKIGVNFLPKDFFSFALTPSLRRTIAAAPQEPGLCLVSGTRKVWQMFTQAFKLSTSHFDCKFKLVWVYPTTRINFFNSKS